MEITTLFGLPAHPLLVHIPIVLLPLVGIGAIAIAVSPKARRRFGTVVLALAGVAFIGTVLAAGSGEGLVESVDSSAAVAKARRPGRGDAPARVRPAVGGGRPCDHRPADAQRQIRPPMDVGQPLGAATIALAVVTTGWLVAVGHNGTAEATWGKVRVESGHDEGLSTSTAGP